MLITIDSELSFREIIDEVRRGKNPNVFKMNDFIVIQALCNNVMNSRIKIFVRCIKARKTQFRKELSEDLNFYYCSTVTPHIYFLPTSLL
jgi:hypothetical protein